MNCAEGVVGSLVVSLVEVGPSVEDSPASDVIGVEDVSPVLALLVVVVLGCAVVAGAVVVVGLSVVVAPVVVVDSALVEVGCAELVDTGPVGLAVEDVIPVVLSWGGVAPVPDSPQALNRALVSIVVARRWARGRIWNNGLDFIMKTQVVSSERLSPVRSAKDRASAEPQ